MPIHQDSPVCRLVHSLPGRVRYKSSVPLPERTHEPLRENVAALQDVLSVSIRPRSQSIVVCYITDRVDGALIHKRVEETLQALRQDPDQEYARHKTDRGEIYRTPGTRRHTSLVAHGLTAVALSAMLLYSLWRGLVRRRPLPQTIGSLTGIVTIAGSIPLFIRAWREWRAGRRMGLFPFLGVSCLIALMVGAASTALNILWTLSVGMFLEELAMEKARRDVRKLAETAPETGQVLEDGIPVEKRVVDMRLGDVAVVHTGWIIPVDGIVVQGQALIDESQITGHQFPELRGQNDWVFGGTTVQEGSIHLEVKRSGHETYLNKVMELVEQALDSRSEVERKADALAARMVKIGTVSTVGTFLLTRNLGTTVAVLLVMSCPCATILAASTALTASIASAARRNVLIKNGAALETMAHVDCACFDKTGTLTLQMPELVEVRTRAPGISEERILAMSAGVEEISRHPIARALVDATREKGIEIPRMNDLEAVLGRGARGYWDGEQIAVGSAQFLQESDVDISYFRRRAEEHLEKGRTPVYVARENKAQGMLVFESVPHPETREVLGRLRQSGIIRLSLISGDEQSAVSSLCASLPFDHCHGGLTPEQKTEYIRKLQQEQFTVCMIGDGVNDALALSTADLGLAVGAGGSDVALEAADVVFMGSGLRDIVELRRIGEKSMRIIDQNFWIGAGSDYFGLGLAFTGMLTPLLGGFIHVGHTLAILLNSSRLLGPGPKRTPNHTRGDGTP